VFSLPVDAQWVMHEYEKDGVKRQYPYCDYELVPQSEWRYAFADNDLQVERHTVGDIPFCENDPPVVVNVNMREIDWGFEEGFDTVCAKVPHSKAAVLETVYKELIPYGCAKLRMTLMPFAE